MNLDLQPPVDNGPGQLIYYGIPKIQKSRAAAALSRYTLPNGSPGAIVLDLENGMATHGGKFTTIPSVDALVATLKELAKIDPPPFALVVDTIDRLDEWAEQEATRKHKLADPAFTEPSVLTIPYGKGYYYYRREMQALMSSIQAIAPHTIYIAHLRDSAIDKTARATDSKDLALWGKMRLKVCSYADSIAYCYLNNKGDLTFNFNPMPNATERVVCGSRCPSLANREIVMMETKTGIDHWPEIFPQLKEATNGS